MKYPVRAVRLIMLTMLLMPLLYGCNKQVHMSPAERVSPAEFEKHYAWVNKPQTMHDVTYLGQRKGQAFIKIRSMSSFDKKKWADRIIYVELNELEPAFREALPKNEIGG